MTQEEIEKLLEQEPCTCDTLPIAMGPHYHVDENQRISRKKLQSMLRLMQQAPTFGQMTLDGKPPYTANVDDGLAQIHDADGKLIAILSEKSFFEIRAAATTRLKKSGGEARE